MDKIELLTRIRAFVTHAKKVHESTRERFKHTIEYAKTLENIQFIKTSLADLSECHSKIQIASRIIAMRKQLREILPNPLNDSFQSSQAEYDLLISVSLREIEIVRGTQPGSSPEHEHTLMREDVNKSVSGPVSGGKQGM